MSNLERKKQAFIESVAPDIKRLGEAFAKTFNKRRLFHEVMQFSITVLAEKFNLKGLREYWVDNIRSDGRGGLIDVV
ncbi:MAG: hypothetical protein QXL14_00785 [Candidatus Aenigmatarchaeota archaeon]